MECKVCKEEFELEKENKYFVDCRNGLFGLSNIFEAFDCPFCGCQNVVNLYKPKYEKMDIKSQNNDNE